MRRKLSVFVTLALLLLSPLSGFATGDGSALIIIDMQPIFVTRGGTDQRPGNQQIVRNILQAQVEAIQAARRVGMPIIFIEYEGDGVTNPVLRQAADGYASQATFLKNTDGMFENGNSHRQELIDFLNQLQVRNLVITGANGGACVEQSIVTGLDTNYNITAYSRGIADFNYDDFIYPYAGHYGSIVPSCAKCTFREVHTLNEAIPPPPPQGHSNDAGVCEPDPPMSEVHEFCEAVNETLGAQGD